MKQVFNPLTGQFDTVLSTASELANVPSGNLAATNVQSALNELQGDIDTINTDIADDVEGPASSTDNAIARFDGTTGKLLQNSTVTVSDTGSIVTAQDITLKSGTSGALDAWEEIIEMGSTGVYTFTGMTINGGDNTKFDIPALDGHIYDAGAQTYTEINYAGSTANTTSTANGVTYVFINSSGAVSKQTSEPTPQDRRDKIYLGRVATNSSVVTQVFNEPVVSRSPANAIYDIAKAIRLFNITGNTFTSNGANLKLNKSSGSIYAIGGNFTTNNKSPDYISLSSGTAVSFSYITQAAGSTEASTSDMVPGFYDNVGTKTAIPGSSNSATVQRIYLFPSGNIRIAYGQTIYTSLSNAIAAINAEAWVDNPAIPGNGLLIALVAITKGCTSLATSTDARILYPSKFGEASTAPAGAATTDLQGAYNNSIDPEILTDSTRGALSIRRGSAADTDAVLEGQNNAGTVNFSVTGNGVVKSTALTASRLLVSDASQNVSSSSVTSTEAGYLSGVTSAIQTQLNAKQATITGAATTITSSDLTASRALVSDSSGKVAVATTTSTEIGYVNGVTSAIQTQINTKMTNPMTTGGDVIYGGASGTPTRLANGSSGQVLTSAGGTSAPTWATPAIALLSTQTASSSSSIDFTSIDTTNYTSFMVVGYNVVPATNAVNLLLRFSVASSFAATNYGHQQWRWVPAGSGASGQAPTSGTGIPINATGDLLANTGTNAGIDFTVTCYNLGNTTYTKKVTGQSTYLGSALISAACGGVYQNTAAVDGIRLIMDSGNITSGTFKLYGMK